MLLRLSILPETFAICRLPAEAPIPESVLKSRFFSITRTADELSLVAPEGDLPEARTEIPIELGWRGIRVEGPLDFGLTGILAGLTAPLAEAEISIFALSTYDTDYLLVRADRLNEACVVLTQAGYIFLE